MPSLPRTRLPRAVLSRGVMAATHSEPPPATTSSSAPPRRHTPTTCRNASSFSRQHRLPASYYRGGTSRAVMFHAHDLPLDRAQWAPIFRGAIGSPDPHGRQLDGMGGGISSLSKVCVVGPSTAADCGADIDYTFAAVGVRDDDVDYSSNCGNMSAAVGPFAVDRGIIVPSLRPSAARDCARAVVVMRNTNTGKLIRSTFPVVVDAAGAVVEAAAGGDFAVDGVAGTAAPVRLEFLDPAGSKTGRLLPSGRPTDVLSEGSMELELTCIDAGNPCVFVRAADLMGVPGSKIPTFDELTPADMENDVGLMEKLDYIRRTAAVRLMGMAEATNDVPGSVPKIAMVWTPRDGERGDICIRALSVGQPHKAVPVTVALSIAAAAGLPGTVVRNLLRKGGQVSGGDVEVHHPSGVLKVNAKYVAEYNLESASVYRTARRLMEGTVFWK